MPDLHDVLDRRASNHDPAPDLFERVLCRHRRRDRNRRIGTVVVMLAVIALAFGGPLWSVRSSHAPADGDGSGGPSASAPPMTPPNEQWAVAVEPGTYRVVHEPSPSAVTYTATVPAGWSVQYGNRFRKERGSSLLVGVYATPVEGIYADACMGSHGDVVEVGAGVDDLAAALLGQSGPQASGPVQTTLGGYPATRIDLTIPAGFAVEDCAFTHAMQLWLAQPKRFTVLFPDTAASVFIVDVDGQRQVFFTERWAGASEEDQQELQAVLDSIRIEI